MTAKLDALWVAHKQWVKAWGEAAEALGGMDVHIDAVNGDSRVDEHLLHEVDDQLLAALKSAAGDLKPGEWKQTALLRNIIGRRAASPGMVKHNTIKEMLGAGDEVALVVTEARDRIASPKPATPRKSKKEEGRKLFLAYRDAHGCDMTAPKLAERLKVATSTVIRWQWWQMEVPERRQAVEEKRAMADSLRMRNRRPTNRDEGVWKGG